ncbi:YciI family protein [Ascidiimonas aurantiaca]|uniref:YciI family protein n=1 Tax=Ascidiimonas aurantiaca TaxID=1685432 RepID=UPI0030ED48F1
MKKVIHLIIILGIITGCNRQPEKQEQAPVADTEVKTMNRSVSEKPETFSYQEGDTTYVMQKYFMVFLKKGPNRDQDSVTAANIQMRHQAYLEELHLAGKISIAGPFEDAGTISGIVIYNTPTYAEADSLAKEDPAVKAGRLLVETHPWWAAKGSKLK